jgi:acetyl esterase/lipase
MTTDAVPAAAAPPLELAELIAAAASHPDPWFAAVAAAAIAPEPDEPDVDAALVGRLEAQAAAGEYQPPAVATEDTAAPGPNGPVPVRVYRPAGAVGPRPLLVWCHGGAFLGGDLDMPEADATAREVCTRAGAVVVSVDYRLAVGGVHHPVPHQDVLAAWDWAVSLAGERGDASCAVIGGASAGANLAAGVALRLRDECRPPTGVMLLYPLVHPELPTPSPELADKLAGLPARHAFRPDTVKAILENYLGAPTCDADPYALAALGDLVDYPQTLVINCEYDGLRASGEAFAAALQSANVPVTQLLAPDVLHGHINSPWLPQAHQSYADMARWLTRLS